MSLCYVVRRDNLVWDQGNGPLDPRYHLTISAMAKKDAQAFFSFAFLGRKQGSSDRIH